MNGGVTQRATCCCLICFERFGAVARADPREIRALAVPNGYNHEMRQRIATDVLVAALRHTAVVHPEAPFSINLKVESLKDIVAEGLKGAKPFGGGEGGAPPPA
jgi:hypothetical protein